MQIVCLFRFRADALSQVNLGVDQANSGRSIYFTDSGCGSLRYHKHCILTEFPIILFMIELNPP